MKPKPELNGNVWKPRPFSKIKEWKGEVRREVYHHGEIVDQTPPGKPKGVPK